MGAKEGTNSVQAVEGITPSWRMYLAEVAEAVDLSQPGGKDK